MQLPHSPRSLATKLLLAAPFSHPHPPSPARCSWQLPCSPHTHGRCWEDCVGGAGHEVRDLPQGPDVGGIVPLLHLLLDEAFQLLPERLKAGPEALVPQCISGSRQGTLFHVPTPPQVSKARATLGILGPQKEDIGQFPWDLGPPQTALGESNKEMLRMDPAHFDLGAVLRIPGNFLCLSDSQGWQDFTLVTKAF